MYVPNSKIEIPELLYPGRRASKSLKINTSHPAAKFLQAFFVFDRGMLYDIVSGQSFEPVYGTYNGSQQFPHERGYGIGYNFTDPGDTTSMLEYNIPTLENLFNKGFSMIADCNIDVTKSATVDLLSVYNNAAGYVTQGWGYNASTPNINIVTNNGTSIGWNAGNIGTKSRGVVGSSFIFTPSGRVADIYVNGTKNSTSGTSGYLVYSQNWTYSHLVMGGSYRSTNTPPYVNYGDQTIRSMQWFNIKLPDEVMMSLTSNPYQILEPA